MANIQSLPYSVLLRIFELCTDFKVSDEDVRFTIYSGTRTDDEGVEPFSRVCRNWRNAAQRKLIERIIVSDCALSNLLFTLKARKDLAQSVKELSVASESSSSPTLYKDSNVSQSINFCKYLTEFGLHLQLANPVLDLSTLTMLKYFDLQLVASEKSFTLTLPPSTTHATIIFMDPETSGAESKGEVFEIIGGSGLSTLAITSLRKSQAPVVSFLKSIKATLENLSIFIRSNFTKTEAGEAFKPFLPSLQRLHFFLAASRENFTQFNMETILPQFKQLIALSISNTAYSKKILGSLPATLLYLELVQQSETWIPYQILNRTSPLNSSPNAPYLAELLLVTDESVFNYGNGEIKIFGRPRALITVDSPPQGLQRLFRLKKMELNQQ